MSKLKANLSENISSTWMKYRQNLKRNASQMDVTGQQTEELVQALQNNFKQKIRSQIPTPQVKSKIGLKEEIKKQLQGFKTKACINNSFDLDLSNIQKTKWNQNVSVQMLRDELQKYKISASKSRNNSVERSKLDPKRLLVNQIQQTVMDRQKTSQSDFNEKLEKFREDKAWRSNTSNNLQSKIKKQHNLTNHISPKATNNKNQVWRISQLERQENGWQMSGKDIFSKKSLLNSKNQIKYENSSIEFDQNIDKEDSQNKDLNLFCKVLSSENESQFDQELLQTNYLSNRSQSKSQDQQENKLEQELTLEKLIQVNVVLENMTKDEFQKLNQNYKNQLNKLLKNVRQKQSGFIQKISDLWEALCSFQPFN